jgi:uncharacterized protein (TIGR02996 family)
MTDLDALLAGIVSDPLEETRWLVLADWLEENDDPRRAELLRLHRRMLATCCEPDAHPERAAWQSRMTELLIAGVRPCVPQETLMLPGGVPMTFSFIPPGAFLMGSEKGEDREKPVHRVAVEQGFFLGIYPVTQAQWFAVMGTDPSQSTGAELPVESVSWEDAQEFCTRLLELVSRGISLPTETEWEYACRSATSTEYYFGDEIHTGLANYNENRSESPLDSFTPTGEQRTTKVGTFPPNAWGLFDCHGNVWEWCAGRDYSYSTCKEWWNPEEPDVVRMIRGGAWTFGPEECRAAFRGRFSRDERWSALGFRVCLRLS